MDVKLGTTHSGEESASSSSATTAQVGKGLRTRRIDRIATDAHGRFVVVLSISVAIALAWSAMTQIDRVTRGGGRIVPESHKQEVQHLEGGLVTEILVKEGDKVKVGQPLMRIENTFFRSELAQAAIDLSAKTLRLTRLEAEVSGAGDLVFGDELKQGAPQAARNEYALFKRRRASLEEQLGVLDQQARQKEIELSELRSRQPSVLRERQIAEERFNSLKRLASAGAASKNELLESERVYEQSQTRVSDLAHDIPRAEASLAEIRQRKAQSVSTFQADAEKDRTQTATEIEKLNQSVSAMQERSRRSDVLASVAGVVNKLNFTTVGSVVRPGQALAEIVPGESSVNVEMRLQPTDRANVWIGQKAVVKVTAYEYSSYGGLPARVVEISPDALQDDRGSPYFRVRLVADGSDFGANHPVLPGMLADIDVLGERQSVLTALLKPLHRIKDNALRQ